MQQSSLTPLFGVGLRKSHYHDFLHGKQHPIDFLEIAPENTMGYGGLCQQAWKHACANWPIAAHSTSLSLCGPDPLMQPFARDLCAFLQEHSITCFSEHLSYSQAFGIQYQDLMPVPFNQPMVRHTIERIEQWQEIFQQPLLVENPTTYLRFPQDEMDEGTFVQQILAASGAYMLLDINNLYVNSQNHGFDPTCALLAMPLQRVKYIHVAGFTDCRNEPIQCLLDTHSAPVCQEVLALLALALQHTGPVPILLEWDHALPSWQALMVEVERIKAYVATHVQFPLPITTSATNLSLQGTCSL